MDKESILDELADDYEDKFGHGGESDSVAEGVDWLVDRLERDDPDAGDSGYRLILRNDLCSFPELDYRSGGIIGKENHLIVDPNPIFSRIKRKREQRGGDSLPCDKHYEMNRIIEFLSNVLPSAPFFQRISDQDSNIADSSRAFFLDSPDYSRFSVAEHSGLIEREIESLSDSMFIKTAFQNPLYRYNVSLDEDVTKDIVKETLLTYFSRLELNSEVNSMIHEYTPKMMEKLYSKTPEESDDLELMVSQLFVAHDWLSDKRKEWLDAPERYARISGEDINVSNYLEGGAQTLLLEIVPKSIDTGKKLRSYPFGQDIRMIHDDEYLKEGNFAQLTNLGDQMKYLMERKDMDEFNNVASSARGYLNDYLKKLPVIHVSYDENHYENSLFD